MAKETIRIGGIRLSERSVRGFSITPGVGERLAFEILVERELSRSDSIAIGMEVTVEMAGRELFRGRVLWVMAVVSVTGGVKIGALEDTELAHANEALGLAAG